MRESPWKSLLESLTSEGFESTYLERLRARVEVAQGRSSLQREIIEEMAQALGRAEDKVNVALVRLQVLDRKIAQERDVARRRRIVEAFNHRREDALRALQDLAIHREALGMYRNEILKTLYPIPSRKVLE